MHMKPKTWTLEGMTHQKEGLTPSEIARQLEQARRIVEVIELRLNDSITPCTTCGFHARENFPEYTLRRQLREVSQKLKRIVNGL